MNGTIARQSVTYTLTVSDALDARLRRMAAADGGSTGEVVAKALALYELAFTARVQSCRLAVVDASNRVQSTIEGVRWTANRIFARSTSTS